ncbi:hypothetical protein CDAR_584441 [Caerostris darwini]|uniref:Uncharacterized protein n=1 Tax=Caerostris darwini TaxID=1538125 RepID=A0AAV4WSC2_9ARAC|nr:hypothetical protein CDAR_584441 [Caerostris darwini]
MSRRMTAGKYLSADICCKDVERIVSARQYGTANTAFNIIGIELYEWKWFLKMAILFAFVFYTKPLKDVRVCRSFQWCPRDGRTERSLTGRNLYGNAAVSDGQKDDRGGIFVRGHLLRGCGKRELFPLEKRGGESLFLFIIDIEVI